MLIIALLAYFGLTWVLYVLLAIYGLNFLLSPFPYWGAWLKIWQAVLFDYGNDRVLLKHRFQFAKRLLSVLIWSPVWTVCWYVDDFLYGNAVSEEQIQKPVFLFNQPRNGSTFFHRTLANYDSFYAIKHIEWRYPFVFVHKLIEWSPLIKKYAYSNFYWSGSDGEQANKYHEAELDSYEEDGIFFEEIFMFHLFNALWYPLPSLVKYTAQFHLLPDKTQKHMMETHKKAIQKVQYMRRMALPEEVRGSTSLYFLSKENESWHKMPLYKAMYPDARYLCIVRPPKDSVTSFYPLLYASMGAKTPGVKMQGEVNQMTAIMVQKRIDCGIHIEHFAQDLKESTSQALSENKHAYIHFDVALPNMLKTFAYVLKHLNLPMTPVFKDKIQVLQEKQNKRSVGGHNSIDESIYTGKGYDEFTAFAQQVKIHHKKVLDTVKFA